MRILHVIDHLGSGGAQTIVRDLAGELGRRGHEVHVAHLFDPNWFEQDLDRLGVPTHRLASGARYLPRNAVDPRPVWALRRLLREHDWDVVHLHLYIAPLHAWLARSVPRDTTPLVNTVHAHQAELPGYVFRAYRMIRGHIDHWVADFPSTIGELESAGVRRDSITFVPFGIVPVDADDAARDEVRLELGLSPDDFVITSVARLHPQRFLERFIAAMPAVLAREPRARLLLVGDGPLDAELRARVGRLGLEHQVVFGGRRSDLGRIYGATDVAVTVSRGGDVGIAALQAVSAGVPTVAWDNAGFAADADSDEGTGITDVVTTADGLARCLVRIASDPGLASRQARERAARIRSLYSVEKMADAHEEIYEAVTSTRGIPDHRP